MGIARIGAVCLVAISLLGSAGCASKKVLVPPRVDLTRYQTIGLIDFSSNGNDELARQATDRFVAVIQGAQPGVPILELGDGAKVLASVEGAGIAPETIKAIGTKYGVDALLVGEFQAENKKPRVSVTSLESMNARASLDGVLSARLFQTASGATVWKNAARGSQTLASLQLTRGVLPGISGQDQETAETNLVQSLVTTLTQDFRSRWVRQ